MLWETITAPFGLPPPQPMTMRAQSIPARHAFPEHAHAWHQVVYAVAGVLTVAVEGRSFVISPEQAVWLPTGLPHRVGSLLGAEFRSLWIAQEAGAGLPERPTIFAVSPLLKALIVEAAAIDGQDDPDGYAGRVTGLILDQLRRSRPMPGALPWPRSSAWYAWPRHSTPIRPFPADPTTGAGNSACPVAPWRAGSRRNWV